MSELLTTDVVSPAERSAYWREVICAVYVELDVVAPAAGPFSGTVSHTAWGDAELSTVASDPQIVTRATGDGRSDCLVSIQLRGVGQVSQDGRTAILHPGDLALYDATRPYQLAFDAPFEQLVVQFDRDALVARNVDLPTSVARRCRGDAGVGAVASTFVRTLRHHEDALAEHQRADLGRRALDLLATALAEATGNTAPGDAVRAINRRRVLAYVDAHLEDRHLAVADVADAFGVSVRTIQKLFADDELTLSGRIRHSRLERARIALRDPRRAHHSVTRIAHDHHFGDAAHFSRAFKAAYGCGPRAYRAGDEPGR
ncbi:MAG: helix-turn-helix domain-containing protein [Actinomycetota bacterium]|nr:helix-turn-helix domain-containing protein [Actinomycetota bacterium]